MNTREEVLNDSPAMLLDEWRDFVQECEAGYPWNAVEYHNDLSFRDRIEAGLADADPAVAAEVAELDARFRALLQPGVQVGPEEDPWWHRGVLRYAGAELAVGLKEWFQVEMEVRERPR
jgi:hypothetical protein